MAVLLSLGACTSLSVFAPYPEVAPSEIPGRNSGGAFRMSVESGQNIKVAEDVSKRPPSIGSPRRKDSGTVSVEPAIGVGSRTQVGLWLDPIHVGFLVTAKYQPVGHPMLMAEHGDFSTTLLSRFGMSSYDQVSGDQKDQFGVGGYPYEGTASLYQGELGFSSGYRPIDILLLYAGASMGWYNARIRVEQGEARNNDAVSGKYKFNQYGRAESYVMGLQIGREFGLGAKLGLTQFRWTALSKRTQLHGACYWEAHY